MIKITIKNGMKEVRVETNELSLSQVLKTAVELFVDMNPELGMKFRSSR